jgi:hypothetical protein
MLNQHINSLRFFNYPRLRSLHPTNMYCWCRFTLSAAQTFQEPCYPLSIQRFPNLLEISMIVFYWLSSWLVSPELDWRVSIFADCHTNSLARHCTVALDLAGLCFRMIIVFVLIGCLGAQQYVVKGMMTYRCKNGSQDAWANNSLFCNYFKK